MVSDQAVLISRNIEKLLSILNLENFVPAHCQGYPQRTRHRAWEIQDKQTDRFTLRSTLAYDFEQRLFRPLEQRRPVWRSAPARFRYLRKRSAPKPRAPRSRSVAAFA